MDFSDLALTLKAASGDVAERSLSEILQSIEFSVDAQLIGVEQETLLP